MPKRTLAAALACAAILATPESAPKAQPAIDETKVDLIRDRPKVLPKLWAAAHDALAWSAETAIQAVDFLIPPSAHSLASHDHGSVRLFRLLGIAGYKLKKIDNEIGLLPGLSFRFAMVREMSEADIDYLEEQLELFRAENPGMLAELKSGIVATVVAINTGKGMQVSELKLTLLPLPKAQFSITPTETVLDEEDSVLLRAIQRVDRRVREFAETEVKAATADPRL